MDNNQLKEEFVKEFCNDHNGYVRHLRSSMDTAEDEIEWWLSRMDLRDKELATQIIGEIPNQCAIVNHPLAKWQLAEKGKWHTDNLKKFLASKYIK